MARMPGAIWAPVSDSNTVKGLTADIICVHTIVGHDPAGAAHFSTGSDGKITQSRDTSVRSSANLDGNYHVIAIENEDIGPEYGNWNTNNGHDVPGFTAAQREAIAQVIAWGCKTHNIPVELIPDSKPGRRGIGYHRQGIDGNYASEGYAYGGRVSGGEKWSSSKGKVCPGDRRITELINQIIPRVHEILGGAEANDMDWNERYNYPSPVNPNYTEPHAVSEVEGANFFHTADLYKAVYKDGVNQIELLSEKLDAILSRLPEA